MRVVDEKQDIKLLWPKLSENVAIALTSLATEPLVKQDA